MMHNIIENILLENIDKPASLFVFPTNVAASRWADRLLRLRGGGTVAMEKFIAWDTFKQESIRSKVSDRKSIPSVLRKMFISALIRENAELCAQGKPPVFTSLIQVQWAQQADSFASWLTDILPQLG
ncbi:MAG: PD-(D/E)XK nuclease family protein, partial [Treponema sp.]|nr:PD-(D/E)XK nuclease family protein [Treponema sp.]